MEKIWKYFKEMREENKELTDAIYCAAIRNPHKYEYDDEIGISYVMSSKRVPFSIVDISIHWATAEMDMDKIPLGARTWNILNDNVHSEFQTYFPKLYSKLSEQGY